MVNLFTVDLEDWYQAIESIPYEDWPKYESRIVRNTEYLLRLLKEYRVKATFFILGYEAERHPDLVKRIFADGHEIATHGYSHRFIYTMRPEEFRAELKRSIDLLESITGKKVLGHRAPAWSITEKSLWALDILLEEGLAYDSSISPTKNYLYGIPNSPRFPYVIRKSNNKTLYEFPMSTVRVGNKNFPFVGGFFTRFFPYPIIQHCIKRVHNSGHGVSVLIHPWDLDVGQPRLDLPVVLRRHYFNLRSTEKKIRRLMKDFHFSSVRETLGTYA